MMGFEHEGLSYERKVYDFLNLFGQVGGFIQVLEIASVFIVSLFCTNLIEAKTVNVFYNNTLGDSSHEAIHK